MDELELRVDGVEEILPTLATRDELHAAITASEHRIRTHFRLVAEAVAVLSERVR